MYDPLRTKSRLVLSTATAFLIGIGIASGFGWTESSMAMPVINETSQVSAAAVAPATDLSEAFVNVANVVTPAVVRIEATISASAARPTPALPPGFEDFFGPPPSQGPRTAGGSGFVVSDEGYILTNDHVVADASSLRVYFPNRHWVEAELVGRDPLTDVAVLKIPSEEVTGTLSFGNSDQIAVGQWVLAIGNPGFGSGSQLDYTVTAGIISARGRNLQLIQRELQREMGAAAADIQGFAIEDYIQTDAVINPGNSGGPMVDMSGRVVGINSAIASRTGYYQGYGFAIPINLARRVMEDLIEFGRVRRPQIGVNIVEVTPEDAEVYGLPRVEGAMVQAVTEGGPAEDAGIRQEDVIVAVDGEPVGYVSQLQGRVAMYRPGDRVTLTVYRDGEPREISVRLGEAPTNTRAAPAATPDPDMVERLGIGVRELTEADARELGYENAQGVVISRVLPGSSAQRRGLIEGELVLEINNTVITEVDDVERALAGVAADEVVRLLLGQPGGGSRVVNIRMPS
ncbi:MAG: trypsin-like peptidase domain-containing protein [Longimicrobiales bacterium]|nr:trypsin-like peptidase domain-containing protein [Longimicrobiales bacterium]